LFTLHSLLSLHAPEANAIHYQTGATPMKGQKAQEIEQDGKNDRKAQKPSAPFVCVA
jgi:hypothetical protein